MSHKTSLEVARNRTRDRLASSNDTKRIQTNNLVPTPQPMTAALIFRRQLVRHKPHLFTASSTADKLPLEKFHRLLDLAFWGGKHQKISILSQIACNPFYVILLDIYLFIYFIFFTFCTGYHTTRRVPLASEWRGRGGRPAVATPPGPRLAINIIK